MNEPLFAPELPKHLPKSNTAGAQDQLGLHVQASEWYESRGQPLLAIQHALAGQAWRRAAYLIDQQADTNLGREEIGELENWLDSLPEAALDDWPRLQIIQAYLYTQAGDSNRAVELADRAVCCLTDPKILPRLHLPASELAHGGREEALGHLDAVQAELALQAGRIEHALDAARQALDRLPLTRPVWRSIACSWAGQALAQSGQGEQACRYFAQARAEADLADALAIGLRFGIQQLDCLWELGRLQDGQRVCQELLGRLLAQEDFDKPLAARLYARWARLLAETGWDEDALAAALQALVMAGEDSESRAEAVLALAQVYLVQGAFQAARQVVSDHPDWLEEHAVASIILRIDIELCDRQPLKARRLFSNLGLDPASRLANQPVELRRLAARLLLVQGRARLAIQRLVALQNEQGVEFAVETSVLLALAYQSLEAEQASLDALSQALFLASPQDWIWPFLRYGREMFPLLYRAAAQGIQPDFIGRLLDRIPPE